MAGPVETSLGALAAILAAALGGYGFTLYMKGDPVSQSIEPADVKTFALKAGASLDSNYKGRFLDITKKDNLSKIVKSVKENKDWWEWAYQFKFEKYKSTVDLDPLFKAIEVGYSSTSPKALNKVCDSIYRQDKSKFNAEDNKFVSNVGSFCTTGSEFLDISEPQAILYSEAPSGYDKGVLKVETNRAKLVKTTVEDTELDNYNEFWWNWAFKNLYQKKVGDTTDSFKTLNKGYSPTKENLSLNKACDEAYKKIYKELKAPGDNKPALRNDISNFCSIAYASSGVEFPSPDTPAFVGSNGSFGTTFNDNNMFVKKGENKNKLVDPDNADNENWWIWTFDMYFYPISNKKHEFGDIFKSVHSAYSANGSNANHYLNQSCKNAYKKKYSDFSKSPSPTPDLLDLIKKFCSPVELSKTLEALTA